MRFILPIVFSVLLVQAQVHATSYILPSWEEQATTSDFIGVVECTTAGGMVARYRVIDSWKGPAAGTEMNIGQHVDPWGPQFPISLVEEHFLVFANKSRSPGGGSWWSGGSTIPLWWRRIPADYGCFSPTQLEEKSGTYLPFPFGGRAIELAPFKADVLDLLKLGPESQELRLMLAVARRELNLPDPIVAVDKVDSEYQDIIELYARLSDAQNVEQLWQRILERATQMAVPPVLKTLKKAPNRRQLYALLEMIRAGGREKCLEQLEKTDFVKWPWPKQELEWAIAEVRQNVSSAHGTATPRETQAEPTKPPPSKDDLLKAEAKLLKRLDDSTVEEFELLCRHAPDAAQSLLLQWQNTSGPNGAEFGYVLGSLFGHLCSKDRVQHLTKLGSAKDDWVKVSAAVYLCFEDAKAGTESLRQIMALSGDPGAWAALVLASRGEKPAMPRALQIIAIPKEYGMASMNHDSQQKRLQVLLSNVASQSHVPQPPALTDKYAEGEKLRIAHRQWHEALMAWWTANQDKITLTDPWAKILEEQKVD